MHKNKILNGLAIFIIIFIAMFIIEYKNAPIDIPVFEFNATSTNNHLPENTEATKQNQNITIVNSTTTDFKYMAITELGRILRFNNFNNIVHTHSISGNSINLTSGVQIYENKLLYINDFGEITLYDLNSNKYSKIDIPENTLLDNEGLPMIASFLLSSNTLFYLYGNNCSGYRETCDLVLKKYNIVTKKISEIKTDAREIFSLNSKQNEIYLEYIDGDAGCLFGNVSIIDSNNLVLKSFFTIQGCSPGSDAYDENGTNSIDLNDGYIKYNNILDFGDISTGILYSTSTTSAEDIKVAINMLYSKGSQQYINLVYIR
jgi:hypothetical protein